MPSVSLGSRQHGWYTARTFKKQITKPTLQGILSFSRLTTASCARASAAQVLNITLGGGCCVLFWIDIDWSEGKRGKVNSESMLPRNPIQFHVLSLAIHLQERTVKPRSPACVRAAEAKNNLIYGLNVSLVRYSLALKLFQYARKRRSWSTRRV